MKIQYLMLCREVILAITLDLSRQLKYVLKDKKTFEFKSYLKYKYSCVSQNKNLLCV